MNNHYQQLLLYGDGETCLGSVRGQFVFIIVCHLIVSIYMRERERSHCKRVHTKNLMSSPQTNRQAMEVNRGRQVTRSNHKISKRGRGFTERKLFLYVDEIETVNIPQMD